MGWNEWHVIMEPCVGIKDKSCVDVCPVDCIYELEEHDEQLYIHPEECIDCGHCVDACPVAAISALGEVPAKWEAYIRAGFERFNLEVPEPYAESPRLVEEQQKELAVKRVVPRERLRKKKSKLEAASRELERERQKRLAESERIRAAARDEIGARLAGSGTRLPVVYWYLNVSLIDSLFSQVEGRFIKERVESSESGHRKTGSMSAMLGNILAALGLGGIEAGVNKETSSTSLTAVTSVLTTENRLGLLFTHWLSEGVVEVFLLGSGDRELHCTLRDTKSEIVLLNGTFDLRKFSGEKILGKNARRKFIEAARFPSRWIRESDIVGLSHFERSRACFAADFGSTSVWVPICFADFRLDSKAAMMQFEEFASHVSEKRFDLSLIGVVDDRRDRFVITPLAIWTDKLRGPRYSWR